MAAAAEIRRAPGSERYASDIQRGRLLSATFALVGEAGYGGVNARRVSERAGVSSSTFYASFSDREDCFLAAFNYAVDGLEVEVREGWESELGWTARVRGALAALLQALNREPAVRRLVFVEALAAGPRVLGSRARVLERLAAVVDGGSANAKAPRPLPPMVAEGVVGGAFGVIHARLLELHPKPLVELLGSLMAMIVLPYRGSAAAARELERPIPRPSATGRDRDGLSRPPLGATATLDYHLTVRAQMALAAVAGRPGLSNREVSVVIGLPDQGQVSRMMKRLQEQGLVENAQTHTKRLVRAWRLTADGQALIDAHRSLQRAQRATRRGGKLVAKSGGRRGKRLDLITADRPAKPGRPEEGPRRFRLTALTHQVLTVVASLNEHGRTPSNLEVAHAAAVKDQGQISKLLARLQTHGLLENTGAGYPAAGNAWQLTPRGAQLLSTSKPAIAGVGQ
jgi:AcrR family transcriptional regulator/DNA-binding MarR family transcriptional regulator